MNMMPRIDAGPARSASRSHVGLVRAINEDRVLDAPAAGLWAIADGMGGHRGGDLAAQTAIDALRRLTEDVVTSAGVRAALAAANDRIVERNRALGLDAGTTVVVALLDGDRAHIGWVGDSRAYRLSGGGAELLTRDHSVVQELVDAGLLTAQLAERHPKANVVTRALGVTDALEVEWRTVPWLAGDRLLLCSDGLSRSLLPDIAAQPVERMADDLLAGALARDGSDNVSLIVAERA